MLLCSRELARSTVKTLLADRDKNRFKLFFEKLKDQAGKYNVIKRPKLPRKTRNICNHHYV